ncbi:MAG: rod shape-determining protein RodA [Acidimicrobiales bacterium]|nr:rod shape-determining protein RodA [Acidimicrobiales bacterium]MCB1015254.1 rod shape-determining protein RodA [Acidimicrobiales bacterium]MCB9372889.1 rod shape-determining protein RodA [Microthrixaceae bacterium]
MAAPGSLARRPVARTRSTVPTPARHIDWILVGAVVALSLLGALLVFSATKGPGGDTPTTTYFLQRQLMFVVLGWAVMAGVAAIDYRHYRDWAIPMSGIVLALLVLVISPLGSESNGAQAWFELAGFQLQPSEFAKLVFILGMSAFLTYDRAGGLDGRRLLIAFGLAAVPMGLIMLQPDLGTVLVFVFAALGMVTVAGVRPRHLAIVALVAIVGTVLILNSPILKAYQVDRLTSFVSPDSDTQGAAYNTKQAVVAIAGGGLTGQGLFNGQQTRLNYVPEQHTDFIFTVVGEELGFLGGALVLGLLGVIVWRIWRTAQLSRDEYGMLVCVGVLSMVVFQVFENTGMTMGIMPVTGIPLPFVSYGGSSILTASAAMGLVLSVHMRRFV